MHTVTHTHTIEAVDWYGYDSAGQLTFPSDQSAGSDPLNVRRQTYFSHKDAFTIGTRYHVLGGFTRSMFECEQQH